MQSLLQHPESPLPPQATESLSGTPVCLPESRLTTATSSDKLTLYFRSVPKPASRLKSVRVLLSEGSDYSAFSNKSVWAEYPGLSAHTRTGLAVLPSTQSYGYVSKTTLNSWFSATATKPIPTQALQNPNWYKTCWQSRIPLVADFTGVDETDFEVPPSTNPNTRPRTIASRNVVLKLNADQRRKLVLAGKAYNYIWNRAVDTVRRLAREDTDGQQRAREVNTAELAKIKAKLDNDLSKARNTLDKALAKANKAITQARDCIAEIRSKRGTLSQTVMKKLETKRRVISSSQKSRTKAKRAYKSRVASAQREFQRKARKVHARKFVSWGITSQAVRACNRYGSSVWTEEHLAFFQVELKNQWRKYTNTDRTRDAAAINVHAILKAQRTKRMPFFAIKKRSRKDNWVAVFNQRDFEGITADDVLGPLMDRHGKKVSAPPSEFKIIHNRSDGSWRLFYTVDASPYPKPREPRAEVMALDPGVNTFMTAVTADDNVVREYGTISDLVQAIAPLKNKAEKLQRFVKLCLEGNVKAEVHLANPKYPERHRRNRVIRRLRRNVHRANTKVSRRIKDAHSCIAKDMCLNAKAILHPEFRVRGMTSRDKSGKLTRKAMLLWSHYKFRGVLQQAARRAGTVVVKTWEPYTSQSCMSCRRITRCSGREFRCRFPDCATVIPRDWNGAVNNMLAFLRA
jgi:transposase